MVDRHSDVAAELWALAETVLTRLEPVLRQAVEDQQQRPQQGCSWCPVCALAALMRGEQHDLLTVVATEGASVVALLRQLMSDHAESTGSPSPPADAAGSNNPDPEGDDGPTSDASHNSDPDIAHDTDDPIVRRAKFVPITVTVKDPTTPKAGA